MIDVGMKAPDFSLPDADGSIHGLGEFSGKFLVLYFYPRDNTPGCTTEACGIRDLHGEIRAAGAAVVGISPDPPASHARFRDKYGLPFLLLADVGKKVMESYGVWGEKKLYGKLVHGVIRSTFIIDGKGIVRKVFPKVSPAGHAAEIVEALAALR
jgi:peroxiredoxin Q/BCP